MSGNEVLTHDSALDPWFPCLLIPSGDFLRETNQPAFHGERVWLRPPRGHPDRCVRRTRFHGCGEITAALMNSSLEPPGWYRKSHTFWENAQPGVQLLVWYKIDYLSPSPSLLDDRLSWAKRRGRQRDRSASFAAQCLPQGPLQDLQNPLRKRHKSKRTYFRISLATPSRQRAGPN